jgi:hypothetical protein
MDWSGPPGGLEKLFAQYDRIVSHGSRGAASAKPSPIEPNPSPSNPPPADEPPWWSPEDLDTKKNEEPVQNLPAPDPLTDGASGGFAKLIGAPLAIKALQSQAAPSYNALRTAPEWETLAEPLLGEGAAEGAAIGAAEAAEGGFALAAPELIPALALGAMGYAALDKAERNQYRNSAVQPGEVTFEVDGKQVPAKTFGNEPDVAPAPVTFRADEKGLGEAYSNPKGTSYDPATKSLYVKGSSTAQDWVDDARLIPFGDTAQSERYGQAMDAYRDLASRGKPVDRVVGHSLGGSVALEMQKNLARQGHQVASRTFGVPVMDLKPFHRYYGKAERHRHPTDPVSIFDRGAAWGDWKAYPHTYTGFAETFDM